MAGVGTRTRRERSPRYRLVRPRVPQAGAVALDETQQRVVAHRAGPLLVLGGPGTGKTTTLVEAVARRVEEGVDPGHILVLTFGRRSSAALRNRIEARVGELVGKATMAEPTVRTFPAYAFAVLRLAAAERGEPAPRLLTGAEQDTVIRDLLQAPDAPRRWPSGLRKAVRTRAFAAELRNLLLRAAERGIGARTLAELGRELGRADWVAAADFLREYLDVLALRDASTRGSIAYDQAELVRSAAALLREDEQLLAAERARCEFVYVDELADTDPAQLDLLALIAGGGPLVAFADPDSATFGFRGGDPAGVRTFGERIGGVSAERIGGVSAEESGAARVTLGVSYRSSPELVAATRRVAGRVTGPWQHRDLTAAAPPTGRGPEVRTLRSTASEAAYVAQRLREIHLREGVAWSRMAVIVRSLRSQQAGLRRAFTQAGIPVATGAEDTALATQPGVAPLLLLLRCALGVTTLDEATAVTLLHSPLGGADPLAERRLRQGLRRMAAVIGDASPSGELLVEALTFPAQLAMVEERWARPAMQVARLLALARAAAARPGASVEDVLWSVWQATGLAQRWGAASARGGRRGVTADRDLDAVMVLFDAAARFTDRLPGARMESFLTDLGEQELPVDTLAATADRGEAVRLLTAHAAKGLEWDVVAVVGVQEGLWPDLRLRGSVLGSEHLVDVLAQRDQPAGKASTAASVSALLDEERRLFYVAATRARHTLIVTAVDPSGTGTGSGGEEQPSRFLRELAGEAPAEGEAPVAGEAPVEGEPSVEGEAPTQEGVRPGVLKRPLTLPALVAELRTVVGDGAADPQRRRAAADQLARLAEAGVPGADPDEWWGLRELSDERALVDPQGLVRVSPSTVDAALTCGLRWLLERHGGSNPPSAKQTIGNLVHAAAMLVDKDWDQVRDYVADHFDAIELPARWLAQSERERAMKMVDKLLSWLSANPREQIAIERDFDARFEATDARPAVSLRGRVDRLERDEHGRLVVVDLKTGGSAPSAKEIGAHPQLAAYQAAVEAGAFPESAESGGAEIVAVGTPSSGPTIRIQPPLADADDPAWARALIDEAATAMAAATFRAVVNDSCPYCAVRTACPLSSKGRQVAQ